MRCMLNILGLIVILMYPLSAVTQEKPQIQITVDNLWPTMDPV